MVLIFQQNLKPAFFNEGITIGLFQKIIKKILPLISSNAKGAVSS